MVSMVFLILLFCGQAYQGRLEIRLEKRRSELAARCAVVKANG